MNHVSVALTAIMLLGLVVFMAPGILALNRGKILRNIAIWLAIFAGLGLFYQYFGPGRMTSGTPPLIMQNTIPPAPDAKSGGSQGFTPPKE
jgi:hypothetical protein